jgi:hypothetical protein
VATTIETLNEGLNSLKTMSTGISELSQLYDFARQCQAFLVSCVESMHNLPANRDIITIKAVLGIIDEILGLYNKTIDKISDIENNN